MNSGQDDIDLLPYRIVGYYEYSQALRYFTALLKRSNADDIKAYNSYIAQRPELFIIDGKRPAKNDSKDKTVESTTGIFDLMALARIELGAVKSAFMGEKNAFFNKSVPLHEYPALRNQLMIGINAHRQNLARNQEFKTEVVKAEKTKGTTKTLAYIRRLIMLNQMTQALVQLNSKIGDTSSLATYKKWESESSYALKTLREKVTRPNVQISYTHSDIRTVGAPCGVSQVMRRLERGGPYAVPIRSPQQRR